VRTTSLRLRGCPRKTQISSRANLVEKTLSQMAWSVTLCRRKLGFHADLKPICKYQTTNAKTFRGVQLQSSQPASVTLYSLAGSLKSSDSDHQLPTANAHQVATQHLATADSQSPVWWKNTLLDKRNREGQLDTSKSKQRDPL